MLWGRGDLASVKAGKWKGVGPTGRRGEQTAGVRPTGRRGKQTAGVGPTGRREIFRPVPALQH